jgi:hypothetical protein
MYHGHTENRRRRPSFRKGRPSSDWTLVRRTVDNSKTRPATRDSRQKLAQLDCGWAKELNLISWNDREPKYDLRDWSADGTKMGKGVTLSKEELIALKELLNSVEV